jgi:hypothetical protein
MHHAPRLAAFRVSVDPRIGADIERGARGQTGRGECHAGLGVRLRDELERDRREQHTATKDGEGGSDALRQPDPSRGDGAGQKAQRDDQPPPNGGAGVRYRVVPRALSISYAAVIRPIWLKAWGKLPSSSSFFVSISSASSPRSLA